MEANEKNLLMGVLTKTLNQTEEEVSDLLYQKADGSDEVTLKEGAFDLILDLDAKRIANVKKTVKPDQKLLEAQYSRGKKEATEELEATIKELTGLESAAKGADLVKEAIEHVSECSMEITDDKIKSHPLYLDLLKKRVPKEDYDKLMLEHETFKSNQDRQAKLSQVRRDALVILRSMNPVESENAKVAENRRNDWLSKLDPYDYDLADDGNHLIKKGDTVVEDKHGNPVKFEEFVRERATEYYDFSQQSQRGQSGNQGGGSPRHVDIPKTEAEYLAKMSELMIKGDKEGAIALQAAWVAKK